MSRNLSKRNMTHSRVDRFIQMSKQEEIIAEKKRLIEAKLKMMQSEGKEAQSSPNKNKLTARKAVQNTFSNDGSFLEKFKKISGSSNSKVNEAESGRRSSNKSDMSYSNDNHSRSGHSSRWNNYKKEDQQSYRDYNQGSYNKPHQNIQHSSYDRNYPSGNHNYLHNNYPAPRVASNSNLSMNNMSGLNFPNNHSLQDNRYAHSNNMLNSPPTYPSYSNDGNNTNNWNSSNSTNPMSNYNSGAAPRQTPLSNPTVHIPALTSLIIPPPSKMQIPTSTNVQVPPPALQPNLSVPPPIPISLQSIPEPKPLETTSIPRPGPLNLLTIPPPLPLCLNQIPKPKDIDVRNIPPPKQYNLSGIEMPPTVCNERNDFYRKSSTVLSTDVPMSRTQGSSHHSDLNQSNPECNPIERVAKLVVEIGDGYEEIFKQKHQHEPEFWFLFEQDTAEYFEYKKLVKKLKDEKSNQDAYSPEELYEPEFSLNDEDDDEDIDENTGKDSKFSTQSSPQKSLVSSFYDDPNEHNTNSDSSSKHERTHSDENEESRRKRKRKSRWGNDQDSKQVIASPPSLVHVPSLGAPTIALPANIAPLTIPVPHMPINKVTRTDRALLQYAKNTFGTTDLSEEDWVKAEDHFKINLLYQEMLRKRNELDRLSRSGKHKYEYDSDEEVEGGTWEHKLRSQEMEATEKWADELTKKSEGKHHIGDFLPPEELKKFMEKYSAAKNGREPNISDYKEYKLNENNVGFQMLQKLGWKDGEGLGSTGSGIVEPINKASNHESNQGLGLDRPDNVQTDDNEYDAYRKRMMLAYRFRPNPLNNPRRPYY